VALGASRDIDFAGTERFSVLRRLGAGGMGAVFEVHDREREARVALKLLSRVDAAGLYRFKREFRAFADLAHPNLVSLYELASKGERWFYTMELIDGIDFLSYVRPKEGPALERLRTSARQLAEGLEALHASGLLHRDLKPSNVLVTRDERVVLLDFGVGTELGPQGLDESTSREIVGTVAYMSPEQAAGLPLSAASDWYGFGAMLYEALTGQPPLVGRARQSLEGASTSTAADDSHSDRWLDLVMAKQKIEPPPPHELVKDVPTDLDELCVRLLSRHPEARPSGREVLAALGEPAKMPTPVPATSSRRPTTQLFGRERHVALLAEALDAAKKGRANTVFVHGSSGVGKTALVRYFLDRVTQNQEAIVLEGRCFERESVPYKGLDSLIDALSRHLARLPNVDATALMPRDVRALARVFPVLGRVDAVLAAPERPSDASDLQELRTRAFGALRELLARIADRKPLVLHIDDLQWGDVDSSALLANLVSPPDPPALLVIISHQRHEAGSSALGLLKERLAGTTIDLPVEPLELEHARKMAEALLGEGDPARAEVIAKESHGNPFLLQELAHHYMDAGSTSGVASLAQVITTRLARVPEEARRLLQTIALAGQPIPDAVALRAAGLGMEGYAALGALRAAHLVRAATSGDTDRVETYHDRIREAVVAGIAPSALQGLHMCLAEALDRSGPVDPEVLATHFRSAGELVRAGAYALAGATQAVRALAFDRAARLYRLAIELLPAVGSDRGDLYAALGEAQANAGRGVEASQAFLAAAALVDARTALDRHRELRRRAAEQLLRAGHIDDGLDLLRAALEASGMRMARTPRRALASLLARRMRLWLRGIRFRERAVLSQADRSRIDIAWSLAVGLSLVDTIRAADFQAQHLLLALDSGVPALIARALATDIGYVALGGTKSKQKTARLVRTVESIAERIEDPYTRCVAVMTSGMAAYFEGDRKHTFELCQRAEQAFLEECSGVSVSWEVHTSRLFAIWAQCYLGRLGDLVRRVPRMLQEASSRGDLYVSTSVGNGLPNMVWLAQDDPAGALERILDGMRQWSQREFHTQHYWKLIAEAQIDLYRGDPTAAWSRVVAIWPDLKRSMMLRIQMVGIEIGHLRARAALALAAETSRASERARLLRAAAADAARLQQTGAPWALPLAALVRAGIAAIEGNAEESARLADQAAFGFDAVDMALYAAAARRRRGELVGGDEGRALIEAADALMQRELIRKPERMVAVLAPGMGRR
jgi:serine/threonine protein kinase